MRKILYRIIIMLLIGILLISSFFIYKNNQEDKKQEEVFEKLFEISISDRVDNEDREDTIPNTTNDNQDRKNTIQNNTNSRKDNIDTNSNSSNIFSNEYNENIRKWHNRKINKIKECNSCKYKFVCGGGCSYKAHLNKGNFQCGNCSPFKENIKIFLEYLIEAGII